MAKSGNSPSATRTPSTTRIIYLTDDYCNGGWRCQTGEPPCGGHWPPDNLDAARSVVVDAVNPFAFVRQAYLDLTSTARRRRS